MALENNSRNRLFLVLALTFLVIAVAVGMLAFGGGSKSGQAIADGSSGSGASDSAGGLGVASVEAGSLQAAASVVPIGGHTASEVGEGTIGNTLTVLGGKVGINFPSPVNALDIAGDIKNTGKITTPQLCLGSGGVVECKTTWPVGGTGAAYASVTETSGNIGIGTTAPTAKLDVAGEVRAQSFALSDGTAIGGAGLIRLSSPETSGTQDCTGVSVVGGYCAIAKGNRWDMPQTKLSFNLAKQSTVTLRMQGSVHVYGGSSPSNALGCGSHYGAGFLVDGVRASNYDWGETVNSIQYTAGTWWQGFAIERDLVLPAGSHLVQGFLYHGEDSTCANLMLDNRENYGPVLFVTVWP